LEQNPQKRTPSNTAFKKKVYGTVQKVVVESGKGSILENESNGVQTQKKTHECKLPGFRSFESY
jgi:hypothetical protein